MKKIISLILSAAVLLTTVSGLGLTAFAGEIIDRGALVVDEEQWVYIENNGDVHSFTFTPETSGYYTLDSYNSDYSYDNYAILYYYDNEEGWQELAYNDDGGEGAYFRLSYSLTAGVQYRYYVKMLEGDETGGFNISLSYIDTSNISGISAVSSITEFIENTNGYNYDDWYCYNSYSIIADCVVTLYYTDGTESEIRFWELNGADYTDNQDTEHWYVGNTYDITITYLGFETTLPVSIVENPVKSVEFVRANGAIELMEHKDSYTDEDWIYDEETDKYISEQYEEYYWRNYIWEDGNQIIVTYKNDTKTVYTFFDGDFISEDGDVLYDDDFSYDDEQWQTGMHWYPGNDYTAYVTIAKYNVSAEVSVRVIENPIKSISFLYADYPEGFTLIENASSGRWKTDYDEEYETEYRYYYYYFNPSLYSEGNQLVVNYKDGTTQTYICDDNDNEWGFFNDNGEQLENEDSLTDWDNQPFSKDGENYVTIEYCGLSCRYPVTVIENPIASISYTPAQPISLVEETQGEYYTDDDGEFYFAYNYYGATEQEGDSLTVNYKDATSEVYTYTYQEKLDEDGDIYEDWGWYNGDGNELDNKYYGVYGISFEDNQESEHWSVGSENYLIALYCGVETKIPVTITESPVKSISLTLAEDIILFENYTHHGWYNTDQRTGERYFYYNAYSINYSDGIGNMLTVNFKDGTSKVYTYDGSHFLDENEDTIEYELNTRVNQSKEHWTVGDNYYDICYAGASAPVKVTITQSPVKSISFTPAAAIKLIEGEDGWDSWDDNDEEYFSYSYSYSIGDKLTVNYKDGTSEVYTYSRQKINGYNHIDFYNAEGKRLYYWLDKSSDQSSSNLWKAGENHSFTLTYIDATTEIPVTIIENPVKSISFNPNRQFVFYGNSDLRWHYNNTYAFANGDTLTVNYKNGSSDTLTYNSDIGKFINGSGEENRYGVSTDFDYDEKTITLNYLGAECTLPVTVVDYTEIKAISYVPSGPVVIDPENYSYYYYMESGEKMVFYKTGLPQSGDKLTLTLVDGSEICYTYVNDAFFDENGNMLYNECYDNTSDGSGMGGGGSEWEADSFSEFVRIDSYNAQLKQQWKAGNTYQVPVTFCGLETSIEVTVSQAHTHIGGTAVKENYIAPTVTAQGSYDMVTRCTVCGKIISSVHYTIDKLPTGWVKDNGKWVYYSKDGSMATGWQKIGGVWYYFNASGIMQTGWVKVGSAWYYMNSSGAMQTGWQKISNVWYYFNASGAMATGWRQVSGKWYYFNSSGAMQTGWQKISGIWYYFDGSGTMKTGWLKLSGKWYYMESSGAMLASTSRKIGNKTYKFNSSGVCTNP